MAESNFLDTFYGRPNTIATYKSLFTKWIEPYLADPKTCNDLRIRMLLKYWERKSLSPRTIKVLLRLTKKYILYEGGPSLEISRMVRSVMRSKQQETVKALTLQEAQSLIYTCKSFDPELALPVQIALYAGLRRGEVFGLQWKDIRSNTLIVSRSYNGPTKSGKARAIPVNKKLQEVLDAQLKKSDNSERVVTKTFDPNPRLKKVCTKASVGEITFHGLRHTFATRALDQGRNVKEVATILGHADVSTTLNIYWQCLKPMDMEIF